MYRKNRWRYSRYVHRDEEKLSTFTNNVQFHEHVFPCFVNGNTQAHRVLPDRLIKNYPIRRNNEMTSSRVCSCSA